jgi:DNA-binding NarL/FixJ family response regulator
MIRTVVIGDRGEELDRIAAALADTRSIDVVGCLSCRRPVAGTIGQLAVALTVIQEPTWSRLPGALIREARHAAPSAALIVRAADATPDWAFEAMNAGATAVLPATVGPDVLGRVVLEIVAEHDPASEADRLRWAA